MRAARDDRLIDDAADRVVLRAVEGIGGAARTGSDEREHCDGEEGGGGRERPARPGSAGGAHRYDRRNDQSLLPMKFSGVTSTIAIAWASTFSRSAPTRPRRMSRLAPSAASDTTRKRMPW